MRKSKAVKPRRTHGRQFKAEVVQLIQSGAKTVPEASRELDVADSLIRKWLRQSGGAQGADTPVALTASEKEELSHLRREVKTLRMEREILKRAATFFAKENA
ncbi:MAG: transposase [Deltaproteobacteria bacterium]|nr:transposase [Deltaproteobacteria bacterium]